MKTEDMARYLLGLVVEGDATVRIKHMVCEMTGLSEEEVFADIDPFGNITVTCKPKNPMKIVETEIVLDGGAQQ